MVGPALRAVRITQTSQLPNLGLSGIWQADADARCTDADARCADADARCADATHAAQKNFLLSRLFFPFSSLVISPVISPAISPAILISNP